MEDFGFLKWIAVIAVIAYNGVRQVRKNAKKAKNAARRRWAKHGRHRGRPFRRNPSLSEKQPKFSRNALPKRPRPENTRIS